MMDLIPLIAAFLIIAVASRQIAGMLQKIRLPIITGLLIMGIISGPYVLDLISQEAVSNLKFVKDISLAFIAFAAGSELYLKELRNRLNSIAWNTFGQFFVTFLIATVGLFVLSDLIPVMSGVSAPVRFSMAILAATIFVARSPSAAIAVINETRARGPFSQTALGVTVVIDILVIILFAICMTLASSLVEGQEISFLFFINIIIELGGAFVLGWLLSKVMGMILMIKRDNLIKPILLLLLGWGVFELTHLIKEYTPGFLGGDIHIEPLLICLIGSFTLSNYSKNRVEFLAIIHKTGLPVYVAFFTITGASVSINYLAEAYLAALLFFGIRLGSMILGSQVGGILARESERFRRVAWMPFVTQAGISLGLAAKVAEEFEWGNEFATLIIGVIVINELIGPPLFKWSIHFMKEDYSRADTPEFDGIRDAIIFGYENQSVALAQQLLRNGWEVKIATHQSDMDAEGLDIRTFDKFDMEAFNDMQAELSEVIVLMKTDEENYELCQFIYENLGTKDVIVRLNNRENFEKFHALGALIVEPSTAMVSLLDHFVRSPQAASLLLGLEKDQDTIDLEVINPNLHGLALRDLQLPNDVIILSLKRRGNMIITHGYTRLRRGDIVTMVGSKDSLHNITLRFDG